MEQIIRIIEFVFNSFLRIWPYLLLTIPLAVIVNLSGAAKYINSAFRKNPVMSVLLATLVGAFSPFCSCGVIPVISSMLIGGVPLAPVMSFWIASPSMDPEIFFLSVSVTGWNLAIWRLASTFVISLLAGYITHFATVKGFIGADILRTQGREENQVTIRSFINSIRYFFSRKQASLKIISSDPHALYSVCCTVPVNAVSEKCGCSAPVVIKSGSCNDPGIKIPVSMWKRVSSEILKASIMVTKFMGIAFLVTALITFYLPEDFISNIISGNSITQVILATLTGIPFYTSNMTALPMVGGMIDLGLNKGAALSFLIAGATTTLPAMVAVWGITKRRVFILYLSFVLFGALLAGLCFNLFN